MKAQWHIVHVSSRTEKRVAERLENKGFVIYLPIQRQLRQWSDRKKWVEAVVLSGYIFVKIKINEQLKVLQTPGVSRFLKHCNVPVFVSETEMKRFRDFVERAENRPIEFTAETLPVGTPVTIQVGQFKGFLGEIVEYKGKRKLSVQLTNFGHFLVTLSFCDVLPQS